MIILFHDDEDADFVFGIQNQNQWILTKMVILCSFHNLLLIENCWKFGIFIRYSLEYSTNRFKLDKSLF